MSSSILGASIIITLALVFYSIGVWAERLAGRLKRWHLACFWLGLACDSVGTGIMFEVAERIGADVHSITGIAAILLMFIHAVWASLVLWRKNEEAITTFHRYSVAVWTIWLVPYLTGFFVSMR